MSLQKKVLLTGANGFLGRALREHLAREGYSLTLGGRSAPPGWNGDFASFDLEDPVSVKRTFAGAAGFDLVIHAAGTLLKNCLRINHEGTRLLLSEIGPRCGRWIQISSAGVYRNDLRSVVSESTECEQVTEYERSKWLADREVLQGHASCVIVRPTMVAGIGMKGSPLRLFAKAAGAGFVPDFDRDACLNMVHVNDVAGAVLHLCREPLPGVARKEFILSDDILLRDAIPIIERSLLRSRPSRRIPDFLLSAAAGAGSALGLQIFNRKRYALLNNTARFSSDRFRALLPTWPVCGSASAIEQVCSESRQQSSRA